MLFPAIELYGINNVAIKTAIEADSVTQVHVPHPPLA
jgi:hypothetical protein